MEGFKDGIARYDKNLPCRWVNHRDINDGFQHPNPVYSRAYETGYDSDHYKCNEEYPENIVSGLEGLFVEPHDDIDLHDGLDLKGYIDQLVEKAVKENRLDLDTVYIVFHIPCRASTIDLDEETGEWYVDEMGDDCMGEDCWMVDNGEVITQGQHQISQITGIGKWSQMKDES